MACRREDVDLDLILKDPTCARLYIAHFDWGPIDPPKYVVFGIESKIHLNNMTDEEAVIAAFIILEDIERPAAIRTAAMFEFGLN